MVLRKIRGGGRPCNWLFPHNVTHCQCVWIWASRWIACENPAPHTLQLIRFSPVCVPIWSFQKQHCKNHDPHCMHITAHCTTQSNLAGSRRFKFTGQGDSRVDIVWGEHPVTSFSPLCVRIWASRQRVHENLSPQTLQFNRFSPACVPIWSFRLQHCENRDYHYMHVNIPITTHCTVKSGGARRFNFIGQGDIRRVDVIGAEHPATGFPPVCVRIWALRQRVHGNISPQTLQFNRFSPACVLIWPFQLQHCESPDQHCMHINGIIIHTATKPPRPVPRYC